MKPDWVIRFCDKTNIMETGTLRQGLQKLSMIENNFPFLIEQKKRFLRK